jgi:hypothetical protein
MGRHHSWRRAEWYVVRDGEGDEPAASPGILGGTSPSANKSLTSRAEELEALREEAAVWRAGGRANGSNVNSSFPAETGLGLPSASVLRSSEASPLKRNVVQIQVRATRGIDAHRSDTPPGHVTEAPLSGYIDVGRRSGGAVRSWGQSPSGRHRRLELRHRERRRGIRRRRTDADGRRRPASAARDASGRDRNGPRAIDSVIGRRIRLISAGGG